MTRSGPADARIPCPLCGGLIHPIAGRCKHCKGDLRELRSARPAAVATLPPLAPPGPAPHGDGRGAPAAEAPSRGTNGHPAAPAAPPQSLVHAVAAAAAAAPIPLAIHYGPADAVPILPPRPTGRLAAPAPRAAWRSWPVIVIILAVIAIVTAVVLMLFPPGGAKDEGTNNSLQPAPERMDTDPSPAPATPRQPPSTAPDPGSRGGATAPTPPDDPDIDDPDVDDALGGRDQFSRRGTGRLGAGRLGLGNPGMAMLSSIFKHACSRLATCGTTSAQTKQLCDVYAQVPSDPPPTCVAASRCLRSIDEMSCDVVDDPTDIWQLKDKLTDCADAMSC